MVHPGWVLFSAYFAATHVATGYLLYNFQVGLPPSLINGGLLGNEDNQPSISLLTLLLSALALIQPLRFLPKIKTGKLESGVLSTFDAVSNYARKTVLGVNRAVLLMLFRVNFLWTLGISIAVSLSPFIYLSSIYGPMALLASAVVIAVVLCWRRHTDMMEWSKKAAKDNDPSTKKRKHVAVIGGGAAGLMAAKEMQGKGHSVTGYERGPMLGGVWSDPEHISSGSCSRVTGQTLSSSSIANSTFSDFQIIKPDGGGNPGYPTHFSEDDFRKYLAAYQEKFDLPRLFRTGTDVIKVERVALQDTDEIVWSLTSKDRATGLETIEEYDVVAVCTGLNQEVRAIDEKNNGGLDRVENIQHTSKAVGVGNKDSDEEYANKTVVIVGLGESSTDTAADIAEVASHVHVIVRSPTLLLPRNTFGTNIAPDHKLTRALLHCPQYLRTMKLMSQTFLFGPFLWVARNLAGLSEDFGVTHDSNCDKKSFQDNWSWEWWLLFHKLSFFHPKAKNGFALTRGHVTKTAPLVKNYMEGKVTFHTAEIKHTSLADDNTGKKLALLLDDGTLIDGVDEVINATGYTTTFPFLSNEGEVDLKCHPIQDRYRLVYHPRLPNMPFIGLARGSVGSIFFGTEMQARWAALVASGDRTLPSPEEMTKLAKEHACQQAGKWPTKIAMVYANAIARNEIGCEPDLATIFATSPKAWFYLMFGPFCASMYRFRGPGNSPDMARQVFEGAPCLVYPLEFPLQQFLELSFGCLSRFWTSIPFFNGEVKHKVTVMRQCVTPFIDLNN